MTPLESKAGDDSADPTATATATPTSTTLSRGTSATPPGAASVKDKARWLQEAFQKKKTNPQGESARDLFGSHIVSNRRTWFQDEAFRKHMEERNIDMHGVAVVEERARFLDELAKKNREKEEQERKDLEERLHNSSKLHGSPTSVAIAAVGLDGAGGEPQDRPVGDADGADEEAASAELTAEDARQSEEESKADAGGAAETTTTGATPVDALLLDDDEEEEGQSSKVSAENPSGRGNGEDVSDSVGADYSDSKGHDTVATEDPVVQVKDEAPGEAGAEGENEGSDDGGKERATAGDDDDDASLTGATGENDDVSSEGGLEDTRDAMTDKEEGEERRGEKADKQVGEDADAEPPIETKDAEIGADGQEQVGDDENESVEDGVPATCTNPAVEGDTTEVVDLVPVGGEGEGQNTEEPAGEDGKDSSGDSPAEAAADSRVEDSQDAGSFAATNGATAGETGGVQAVDDAPKAMPCLFASPVFAKQRSKMDFFLPVACSCPDCQRILLPSDSTEDPTALKNLLRPWQVDFLQSEGITTARQLVAAEKGEARHELCRKLKHWRKEKMEKRAKKISCVMALHIWSRTAEDILKSTEKEEQKQSNGRFVIV